MGSNGTRSCIWNNVFAILLKYSIISTNTPYATDTPPRQILTVADSSRPLRSRWPLHLADYRRSLCTDRECVGGGVLIVIGKGQWYGHPAPRRNPEERKVTALFCIVDSLKRGPVAPTFVSSAQADGLRRAGSWLPLDYLRPLVWTRSSAG